MLIRTKRLLIRPYVESDIEDAFEIYSDDAVTRWLGGSANLPNSPDEMLPRIENWSLYQIQNPGFGLWAIEYQSQNRVVGSVLLKPLPEGDDIEIGWHVARQSWGNGYAPEAGMAIRDYAFTELGLKRIVAVAYPENLKSLRVMEKLGMTREGMVRQFGLDLIQYAFESG